MFFLHPLKGRNSPASTHAPNTLEAEPDEEALPSPAMTCTERQFHSISRENNMNAVRYYLALCILFSHFATLTGEQTLQLPRIFGGAGSFFALSGFLMLSSFEKHRDTKRFLIRRARRILPPYILVVLVAAIVCAGVSSLPADEYFGSTGFWKYLLANLSFLNFLCPDLPGVFPPSTNLVPHVNGALWTMKGEIVCYLSVPLIYRLIRRKPTHTRTILFSTIALLALLCIACLVGEKTTGRPLEVLRRQFLVMMLFYVGAAINLLLPTFYRYRYAVLAVSGSLLLASHLDCLPLPSSLEWLYYALAAPLVTGSMVIVCTITGQWGKSLAQHDAISYDIYLVHFPVIQLALHFGLVKSLGAYPALLLCTICSIALAYLSNKYVSKRFLAK